MCKTIAVYRNAPRILADRGLPETHKIAHVEPDGFGGALVDIVDCCGNLARVVELSSGQIADLVSEGVAK